MKSKEEFTNAYADHLCGMLLMLFAKSENANLDMAQRGRWMQEQIDRVRPMLRQMYEFIKDEPVTLPEPKAENLEETAETFLKRWAKVDAQVQEKIVAKFRAAWKKETKNEAIPPTPQANTPTGSR